MSDIAPTPLQGGWLADEPTYRAVQLVRIADALIGLNSQELPFEDGADVPSIRSLGRGYRHRSAHGIALHTLGSEEDGSAELALDDAAVGGLLENVRRLRSARSALTLLYAHLSHPDPLVRSTAAASLPALPIGHRQADPVQTSVINEAAASRSSTLRALAAIATSRPTDRSGADRDAVSPPEVEDQFPPMYQASIIPDAPEIESGSADAKEGTSSGSESTSNSENYGQVADNAQIPGPPSPTFSTTVHGTFAALNAVEKRWYRPKSPLPTRLRQSVSRDLYVREDYFEWEGRWTEQSRIRGARKLLQWCEVHGIDALDTVYAHSHGGNVVLSAIDMGLPIRLLVLLHTPVLQRTSAAWARIQARVGRVYDLRNRFDIVVLIDGLFTGSRPAFRNELTNLESPAQPLTDLLNTSHSTYIREDTWIGRDLFRAVSAQRALI